MKKIQPTCILIPFLPKGFLEACGIEKLEKGSGFSYANTENFTLIYTMIGAPFVGDTVLSLANTPAENLILFGACGAVQKTKHLDIGKLVAVNRALNLESFSNLVEENLNHEDYSFADKKLLALFLQKYKTDLVLANCATFGSIRLEKKYLKFLKGNKVGVVDMECSAFFKATEKIKRKALAVFFITDIIEEHADCPNFQMNDPRLSKAIQKAVKILSDFTSSLKASQL